MNRKILCACLALAVMIPCAHAQRKFISHRGVDLKHTIAGENSLEAIHLAKRAGFQAIETDVRLTADDSLVVMHDPGLSRTCIYSDGRDIPKSVEIKNISWNDLQKDYKLRADAPSRQSRIPSLRTYLNECKKVGIFPFIEPKLTDSTGRHYREIMRVADSVLGRGNYIITSNNRANDIIRNTVGDKDVRLMGILYQSTYPAISNLGNIIMAVSATRIEPEKYKEYHLQAHADGLESESHADKFKHFDMINQSPVDWVSTDMLIPDYHGQGKVVETGSFASFGGLYLSFDLEGEAEVELGNQEFTVDSTNMKRNIRHQVALYNIKPKFKVTPIGNSKVSNVKFLQVEF